MAIKRPDIYEHNNPVLAIVDSDFLRGGGRVVADLTALYALSSKSDQLKERVTKVWVTAESAYYILIDDTNIGNSNGWEEETSGATAWGTITGTLSSQTDLQSALDGKQATITGAATTIDTEDLTASRSLVSDGSGKVAVSSVTSTELGYVSGVTSAIQTQLDGKVDENAAITGATKTKITYDAKGLVTAGADATTADIADSTNKRYVTDAQLTVIGNTSGTNSGDNATNSQYSGLDAAKTNKLITTNRQTASYTLVLSDADKLVEMNVGSANNLTIPLNSSVAFPTGTQILLAQYGAGQTTVVATSGVTVRSNGGKLKLNVQYSGATLIKIAENEWYLFGDIVS